MTSSPAPSSPALALAAPWASGGSCSDGRWRWRPSRAARRCSARPRGRRRRSGSAPGCGSPRRSRAARRWSWCRPTRSAPRPPGSGRCGAGGDRRRGRALAARRGVLRHRAAARPSAAGPRRSSPGPGGRSAPPARLGAGPNRLSAHAAATRMRARRPPLVVSERAAARSGRAPAGERAARPPHGPEADGPRRAAEQVRGARRSSPASTRSSGSGCGRWASSPRCPPPRSPTASASRGCARCGWRAAATSRFAPGARTRRSSAGSACPRRPRASSSSARSGCWSSACSPTRRAGDGRSAGCGSRRGSPASGGWRSEVALRSAAVDPERLRLALAPALAELPGPAAWLGLRALELGPEPGEQQALARSPDYERRAPARRGGAPGALGRRPRRGPAGGRGRSRLPGPRAPGDPDPVRRARR